MNNEESWIDEQLQLLEQAEAHIMAALERLKEKEQLPLFR